MCANLKQMWSLLLLLLRFKVAGALFLGPFVVALFLYFGGLFWFGPAVDGSFAMSFSSFFSAAATVTAGALIALALEARLLIPSSRPVSRLAAALAFIYAVSGEVAAVVALSPSLSAYAYRQAFAVTVGGGGGLLVAVLLVALRGVNEAAGARELAELNRLSKLGDASATLLVSRAAATASRGDS